MSRVNDGTDDCYLSGTIATPIDLSADHEITLFCWIKKTDWDIVADYFMAFGRPISEAAGQDNIYSMGHPTTADTFRCSAFSPTAGTSNPQDTAGTADEADGIWVPCMFNVSVASGGTVFARTVRWLYPRESGTTGTTSYPMNAAAADEIYIGGRYLGDFASLIGKIAEVAIWYGIAMGATEFDQLVTGAETGISPDQVNPGYLVAYYPLNTSSLADASGNGASDLTVTGTFAYDPDHPNITRAGYAVTPNPASLVAT